MLPAGGDLHCLRDLTRGGLAAALNEIALDARRGHRAGRGGHPRQRAGRRGLRVAGARSALRGQRGTHDRLSCRPRLPRACWKSCAATRRRRGAAVIGRVTAAHPGTVEIRSRLGGSRIVDLLSGEQMPRIC